MNRTEQEQGDWSLDKNKCSVIIYWKRDTLKKWFCELEEKKCDRLTPLHSAKHSWGLKKQKKFVIHNLYEDRGQRTEDRGHSEREKSPDNPSLSAHKLLLR